MLAYQYIQKQDNDTTQMTHSKVEKIVKDVKVHRNVMDTDTSFLCDVWKCKHEWTTVLNM